MSNKKIKSASISMLWLCILPFHTSWCYHYHNYDNTNLNPKTKYRQAIFVCQHCRPTKISHLYSKTGWFLAFNFYWL